jgi:hypothetical protein
LKLRSQLRLASLVALALVTVLAAIACKSEPEPTVEPTATPATAVSFPYIFSGNLTVNGEPGPQGVPVFARLGSGRGPYNNTVRPGVYTNVSVAPTSPEDIGKEITFFLGLPDGPNVQADQTYVFNVTSQPMFISLDLNFPSLP